MEEEGTELAPRCSPRVHPQNHASDEGAGMARRIRRCSGKSQADPASLPDDDDMLREIIMRLPPQPSSLPRASAVCKRWLGLITDPKFICRFRAHHGKPPLLGVIQQRNQGISFTPVLDPPNRIPPQRFDFGLCSSPCSYYLLDSRHGLVLIQDWARQEIIVCNPITSEQRRMAIPLEFKSGNVKGAVLCAAGGLGHVHGNCHLSSYKAVLVSTGRSHNQPLACVYSLETGVWGNLITTEAPCEILFGASPATLVGNVLYWLLRSNCILAFDLDRQNLAVTVGPPVTNEFLHGNYQIILAEDGAVGLAILAYPRLQMWQRNINCQGVPTWVPWKTVEMHKILGLSLQIGEEEIWLLGYDEDINVMFVYVGSNVYVVQLKSMESKKLYETNCTNQIRPFMSFYTPGTAIAGGFNRAERLSGLVC